MNKPLIEMKYLKEYNQGEICFIFGSGESLLKSLPTIFKYDFDKIKDSFRISINRRPLQLIPCDMIVSIDFTQAEFNWNHIKHDTIKISPFDKYSDYKLDILVPIDGRYSSLLATWLACYMEFKEIVLVGMDCYQGKKRYFDSDENIPYECNHGNNDLESHFATWRRVAEKCSNPERIKALNNPLEKVFGRWEGK